jgi:hypothetical protein
VPARHTEVLPGQDLRHHAIEITMPSSELTVQIWVPADAPETDLGDGPINRRGIGLSGVNTR